MNIVKYDPPEEVQMLIERERQLFDILAEIRLVWDKAGRPGDPVINLVAAFQGVYVATVMRRGLNK